MKALFTFTFLSTFHFETEAAKNGTQVLNLAERAGVVSYDQNRKPKNYIQSGGVWVSSARAN